MKRKSIKKVLLALILIMLLMLICAKSVYAGGTHMVDDVIDGIVGILCYPLRLIPILIGAICQLVANAIANKGAGFLTLDQIIFSASGWSGNTHESLVPVASVDFFGLENDAYWNNDQIFITIRNSVATWYVGVRNLAAIILIVIALYVGIRMAIATVAEEQAKYKNMLYDWLKGLGLLFAMHFIMLFIIYINDALVRAIGGSLTGNNAIAGNKDSLKGVYDDYLIGSLATISFTVGTTKALIYAGLSLLTLTYLITYIKRMITIAFLIIISPLVTVTYSLDKMGDNKSQALNEWFKEFTYNILIQPFHCIIYRSLVVVAINILNRSDPIDGGDASIASGIIAIMLIAFMSTAEKMVKHIFHFDAKHMADPVTEAAVIGAAMSKATSGGSNKNKYADEGEDTSGGGGGGGGMPTPPPVTGDPRGVNASGKDRRRDTIPRVDDDAKKRARSKMGKKIDRSTGTEKDKFFKSVGKTKGGKVARSIGGAYGSLLKAGIKATTVGTIGAMTYMATGSMGKGIAAAYAANGVQKKALTRADEQNITQSRRELSKAYHDYQDTTGADDATTQARVTALMAMDDTTAAGLSNEEQNLRLKAMQLRNDYRKRAGIKDNTKLDRAMLKSLYGIQSGDIGEYSNTERYYVKGRNLITGRPRIK